MSSEWPPQRLDQIAEINPTRKVRKGSEVQFVDMAALPQLARDISLAGVVIREAKGAGAHFQNGDTLLARITPCLENGKTAQVRCLGEAAVGEGSTEFIVLCGKKTADNDYIYYLCREPAFREYAIGRMEGTSGRQRVSWQSIAAYEFPFPPPDERRWAAKILSALDDRITLLRETNTTLEAIAQTLFKSWFVDFDPVHAKMQGRAPEGMDETTAALFPDSFEESELGDVPKGWRSGDLNTLAELNPESWSAKHHPGRVLYVDLANTKAGQIDDYIDFSFEEAPSRARRVLRCGDVIVGTVRPGNRSFARIASDVTGLTGSTGFAVLRSREVVDQALVYIAATNDEAIDRLSHLADGGAYPAVRPEVVGTTTLVIAPKAIRNSFGEIANPLFASIGANQDCMKQLASLRDTLLPRLISGQLQLPEVGQFSESLP